jgi:hypothetical protein
MQQQNSLLYLRKAVGLYRLQIVFNKKWIYADSRGYSFFIAAAQSVYHIQFAKKRIQRWKYQLNWSRFGICLKILNNTDTARQVFVSQGVLKFENIKLFADTNEFFNIIFVYRFSLAKINQYLFDLIFDPAQVITNMIYQQH